MTHTPGPWYVEGESDNVGEAEVIVSGIPNGGGRIVAWTANSYEADTDNETTTDDDRANARLIAAAPELLMVLSYALADLDDVMPEYEPSGDRTHPGWQTIEDIKVALAKATAQKETA